MFADTQKASPHARRINVNFNPAGLGEADKGRQ
jgi:hypothetical protein